MRRYLLVLGLLVLAPVRGGAPPSPARPWVWTVHTLILPHLSPRGIVLVTAQRRAIVVADRGDQGGAVSTLELGTGRLLRTVAISGQPGAVTSADYRVLVTTCPTGAWQTGSLVLIDARSGRLVRTVALDADCGAIAVDRQQQHAFLLDAGDDTVVMLDARSGRVLHRVPVGTAMADVLAVDDQSSRLLVLAPEGYVSIVDTRSGTLLNTVPVDPNALEITVFPGERRAYVTNAETDYAQLLDTHRAALVGTIFAGTGTLVGDRGTGHAFGLDMQGGPNLVRMLDARTGHLLRVISTGEDVVDAAVDVQTHRLFLRSACGTVSILDTRSGTLLRTAAADCTDDRQDVLAGSAGVLAVDARHDRVLTTGLGSTYGQQGYTGEGDVTVLDATSGATLGRLAVGVNPVAIAVDERTGHAIVVNQGGAIQVGPTTYRDVPGGVSLIAQAH